MSIYSKRLLQFSMKTTVVYRCSKYDLYQNRLCTLFGRFILLIRAPLLRSDTILYNWEIRVVFLPVTNLTNAEPIIRFMFFFLSKSLPLFVGFASETFVYQRILRNTLPKPVQYACNSYKKICTSFTTCIQLIKVISRNHPTILFSICE